MIVQTTPTVISGHAGEIANYVEDLIKDINDHLQRSVVLGLMANGVYQALNDIFDECSIEGWDGENAVPLSKEVLRNARAFLKTLPIGIKVPVVDAEPDGAITFEWYVNQENLVSVSVGVDGFIYYAALVGIRKRHGSDPIDGNDPTELVHLIQSIYRR